jgi:hypothetical protein
MQTEREFVIAAIQTLHARAKPAAYVVAEVNVKDPDGYKKEFLSQSLKAKVASDSRVVGKQSRS